MLKKFLITSFMLLTFQLSQAESQDVEEREIEHLLTTVGSSGCAFIRNGKQHEPAEAESHLRMKYRKGKRFISSADQFIERIATESSWTGRAYQVSCPNEEPRDSGPWLQAELKRYRSKQSP